MTMHHLTRKKAAVDLISKSCPAMPYHKVLEADNATAQDAMQNMDPRTGAIIPTNLVPGCPIRLGTDNIDTDNESAIAGHAQGSTVHKL